jgi:hypothetical protein
MFEPRAKNMGREVTLLIAVASAGFVVPYERMGLGNTKHPSGDQKTFASTLTALSELFQKPFASTPLCGDRSSWLRGEIKDLSRLPDEWDKSKNVGNIKTQRILKILRRGLAHGNIWTRGNPIDALVLAGEVRDSTGLVIKYEFLQMPPSQFKTMLNSWFDFLQTHGIDTIRAADALGKAA